VLGARCAWTCPSPLYPAGSGLLADETVVVTEAARAGIGGATARRCRDEGA
jgi:3-oxoacyl-[acyl-carrier protein] reductase